MASLAEALRIAKKWPIFPCTQSKKPRLSNWQAVATQDPDVIRGWWRKWPDSLIGIPSGPRSGLLILDIDIKGTVNGIETIRKLGWALPPTFIYQTKTGGQHAYFKYPNEGLIRNSAGKLGEGLDIRGAGGYVVCWAAEDGCPILLKEHVAAPPQCLLDAIQEKESPRSGAPNPDASASIGQGGRNAHLASLGGSMRRRGMSEPAILAALMAENAEKCRPPLPDSEVVTVAASVSRYAPAGARAPGNGAAGTPSDESTEGADESTTPVPIGRGWIDSDQAPPSSLISPLIPDDAFTLFAPGGTAKSTVAMWLAVHVVTGLPIFGKPIRKPGPVLYVTAEDARAVLEYRLKEICSAMQLAREQWEAVADGMFIEDVIDLGERARLSAVGEYGNLAFTSFMARLAERYKPIRPRLAFLDPANFFGPGERFLNDGDASLMRAMRKLSRDFGGAAVGALAHTGKAVYREGIVDQYAGRGGSAQADNSRAGLQLVPHGPEDSADHPPPPGISLEEIADGRVFRLHSHKFSYGKRETRPFWIRRDGFKFEGFEPFAPDEAERREKARAEAEALAAEDANTLAVFILRNSGHHWTKTALRESSDTIGLTWRRLSAALVWAVSHGKLVETLFPAGANSRGARCYYTVPGGAQ